MPIRIKPKYDLGLCMLDLEGIKAIAERVNTDFPSALYTAFDGMWEVYDEPKDGFINAISQRQTLDGIKITGSLQTQNDERKLTIVFDDKEANVTVIASQDYFDWYEHFLIDIKKYILPPSLNQRFGSVNDIHFGIGIPLLLVRPYIPIAIKGTTYCRITIKKKPPNPLMENVKAGIITNFLWWIITGLVGAGVGFVLVYFR